MPNDTRVEANTQALAPSWLRPTSAATKPISFDKCGARALKKSAEGLGNPYTSK